MIEQVAGLMYVAFVISRVVGLTVTRQRRDPLVFTRSAAPVTADAVSEPGGGDAVEPG